MSSTYFRDLLAGMGVNSRLTINRRDCSVLGVDCPEVVREFDHKELTAAIEAMEARPEPDQEPEPENAADPGDDTAPKKAAPKKKATKRR